MRRQETRIKTLSDSIQAGRTPALSPVEALALLHQALKEDTDTVPEGWYSVRDLEALWNKANSSASKIARACVEKGIADRKNFRINTGAIVKAVPHYRFHARPLASKTPTPMAQGLPPRVA